jgi:hypothetical protein
MIAALPHPAIFFLLREQPPIMAAPKIYYEHDAQVEFFDAFGRDRQVSWFSIPQVQSESLRKRKSLYLNAHHSTKSVLEKAAHRYVAIRGVGSFVPSF